MKEIGENRDRNAGTRTYVWIVGPVIVVTLDIAEEKAILCAMVAVANFSLVTFAVSVDTATLLVVPIG